MERKSSQKSTSLNVCPKEDDDYHHIIRQLKRLQLKFPLLIDFAFSFLI